MRDRAEVLLERKRLVFVHDERHVAAPAARFENHPQRGRCVLPNSQPSSEDVDLVHLEHRRWRRQGGVRLGDTEKLKQARQKHLGLPVFDTVAEAKAKTDCKIGRAHV